MVLTYTANQTAMLDAGDIVTDVFNYTLTDGSQLTSQQLQLL